MSSFVGMQAATLLFTEFPSTAPRTYPKDLVHGDADNILKPEDVEDKVVGPLRVPNSLLQDGFFFFLGAQLLCLGRRLTPGSAGLCGALCCRLLQLRLLSLRAGIGSLLQKKGVARGRGSATHPNWHDN